MQTRTDDIPPQRLVRKTAAAIDDPDCPPLTDARLAKIREGRKRILTKEKGRLIAVGQSMRERHDRLHETLAALKIEREAQGISLAELERRTGISKGRLSRLENDPAPNPTIGTLSRIAAALGREVHVNLKPAA